MADITESDFSIPIPTIVPEEEAQYVLERTKHAFERRSFQLINGLVPVNKDTPDDKNLIREALIEAGIPPDPKKIEVNETVRQWVAEAMWNNTSELVEDIPKMRNYIKTKLFVESNGEKASDRIKALETLGKMSDLGMFAERVELSIENKSTEELRQDLNSRLAKYMGKVTRVKVDKKVDRKAMIIDLNAELGLDNPKDEE